MNNYHAIETEAVFRQREWQRAATADARAALARPANGRVSRVSRIRLGLRSLQLPLALSLMPAQTATSC